ncbi:cell division protein SepF [Corynebacterium sp. HS2168-gen11]|uniref:cell division protein SepF n=1 Tax=Corynebacterium sp. HS2168-gen11 TaxID=2974027 RepID=UPI00216AD54F|nr:cell division protein SepF [Corynebacterium sp. HS2168-gen11]MCS4536202.1 cell division protein SepF [Corynebacterium sp. HS2168-gen11]
MSLIGKVTNEAKQFFGIGPIDYETDDAYYEESVGYETHSGYNAREAESRSDYSYHPERTNYRSTIVPVTITEYNDAVRIGEPFRDGDAVVFDLSALSAGDAKRIVDFVAGLCFALRGTMQKLENRVFAVAPEHSRVTLEELRQAVRGH